MSSTTDEFLLLYTFGLFPTRFVSIGSVAKCRGSWVVGRGRGSWVWGSVVGKNKIIVAKFMKKISII